jgi:hypothetical protein
MKKLACLLALLTLAALPRLAAAQYNRPEPTRSVLKTVDEVEFAGYHTGSLAGPGVSGCSHVHVGCSTGVCYGYDNCCCRPHLLCALKKVGRMLDCLLPCNKGCHGGCLFGGCRPHLFHRGCCSTVGCSSAVEPGCGCAGPIGQPYPSDPFIDDPVQPMPPAHPAQDVRSRQVPTSPYAARQASPYKVTTHQELGRRMPTPASKPRSIPATATVRDKFAMHSGTTLTQPAARLQQVSHEVTLEEVPGTAARTSLAPVSARRAVQPSAAELDIPVNPLRASR